jgi:hypothetical protein
VPVIKEKLKSLIKFSHLKRKVCSILKKSKQPQFRAEMHQSNQI